MKLFRTLFLIFAICAFTLSAFSLVSSARAINTAAEAAPGDRSYIVRYAGGAVTVYENGSNEALGCIDVQFSELPEEDRRLLECGILVEGDDRLMSVIEDYTG